MQTRHTGSWLITLSFLLALSLTILPLPDGVSAWRPLWVAMVLIYWCTAIPERIGLWVAWSVGLLMDVLQGSVLGAHALGLTLLSCVVLSTHYRLRATPLMHQTLLVFVYLFIYGLLVGFILRLLGVASSILESASMALSSMVLWPWLFIVLRDLRRRYVG